MIIQLLNVLIRKKITRKRKESHFYFISVLATIDSDEPSSPSRVAQDGMSSKQTQNNSIYKKSPTFLHFHISLKKNLNACFKNICPLKGQRNKHMRDKARLVADCKILELYKYLYKCKHFLWWGEEIWVSGVLAWAWGESLPYCIVWVQMGGGLK